MSFFAPAAGAAVKFNGAGDTFTGVISGPLSQRESTDPITKAVRTTKKGNPVMEILVPLKDNMGNEKTLYASAWRQKQAISDAMVAAGVQDVEVGGTLTVTLTGKVQGDGPQPANAWSASYQPPNAAGAAPQAAAPMQQQYADPNAYAQPQGYGQPAPQQQYAAGGYDPNAGQPNYGQQMQAPVQNYGQPMQQAAPGYGQPANIPAPY